MIGLREALRGSATGSERWTRPRLTGIVLVSAGIVACFVVAARWFLDSPTGADFLASYPGHSRLPADAAGGAPWWVQLQHAFNFLFIILLIRSGWLIHQQARPEAYWIRNNTGRFKTKRRPTKMSLYLWLHLSMDVLWVLNGIVFVVALFVTGNWRRIVPVHWDIVPNAVSAGLQYLSFEWPVNDPWAGYNALQLIAYGATVLIAAPLAAVTGIRMSPVWRSEWRISRIYPIEVARAIHLPVMIYFSAFIVGHFALVLSTGAGENLNFMYANQPPGSTSWWGPAIFSVTFLVVILAWIAARPFFMQGVARLTGKVTSR